MHLVCLSIVRHVESVASFGWKWNLKLEGVLQKVTEKLNIFNWIIEKITVSHWAGCQGNNSRISPQLDEIVIVFLSSLLAYPQLQKCHLSASTDGLSVTCLMPPQSHFHEQSIALKAPSPVSGLQKGLCCWKLCPLLAGPISALLLPTNIAFSRRGKRRLFLRQQSRFECKIWTSWRTFQL